MNVLGLFMRVQQTNNKYSCKVPPGKINRRHIFRCFWWYLFIFAALAGIVFGLTARSFSFLANYWVLFLPVPPIRRWPVFLWGLSSLGSKTAYSLPWRWLWPTFFRDTPAFTAVSSSAVPNTFSWGGSGEGPCTICRGVFLSLFFMLRSVQEAFNHLHLQQSTPKGQTQMLLQIMMLNDNQGQIT